MSITQNQTVNSNTEIRKLQSTVIYELSMLLNIQDSWKKIMAIIPKDGDSGQHKFSSEHFSLIEQGSRQQRRGCAEIFLDKWSTMGRTRPTIGKLLDLLTQAELYRAADYIAIQVLNRNEGPKRPQSGPAAPIDIDSLLRGRQEDIVESSSLISGNVYKGKSFLNKAQNPPEYIPQEEVMFHQIPACLNDIDSSTIFTSENEKSFRSESSICDSTNELCSSEETRNSEFEVKHGELFTKMDFSKVPLHALSLESQQLISTLLNPPKIHLPGEKWPGDWRGLACVLNIPGEKIPFLTSQEDPSRTILESLKEKNTKVTFKDLQNAFEKIDRWDVLDDTEPLFEKDAQTHLERIERSQLNPEAIVNNADADMLTVDDLYRFRAGLEKQFYDAFLLYADEDFEFAKEMIDRLERENLKLCTKDRDLIAGVTFEHDAIMQLISDRCNRLIVIISPNFLESPANKFFLAYATAIGIEKQQRKVIPCIYKDCILPRELSYTNKANYSRRGFYDFWGKLCDSIRTPSAPESKKDSLAPSSYNSETLEKTALTSNLENDKKETTLSPEENECKENGFLKMEERTSDSISLPSLPSLDDVDLLPAYSSGTEKKKKPTILKRFKKLLKA